jgi:hypothetical protein
MAGKSSPGSTVSTVSVNSYEECQALCEQEEQCLLAEYNHNTLTCQIKDTLSTFTEEENTTLFSKFCGKTTSITSFFLKSHKIFY